MNRRRLWAVFKARNREFLRDRSAVGWNILFPFLIVAGFGVIFGGENHTEFKVGLFPHAAEVATVRDLTMPGPFKQARYLNYIGFPDQGAGLEKLKHHKIDFLLKLDGPPYAYWVADDQPNGYIVEQMFRAALAGKSADEAARKQHIEGRRIRYIDFLFPGILAMNMMFSAFWGVGYVVVRYRKNGVLKRLKATPLTALEYLTAQMLSRIILLMATLVIVWAGSDLIFDFHVYGSYLDLLVVFFIGGMNLCAIGLILASRGVSEEFTSGVLNFISWPMMFLSEVWFSLEGAPQWVIGFSKIFPLTHMIAAIRKIMNDGAGLADVAPEVAILLGLTAVFIMIASALFSWDR